MTCTVIEGTTIANELVISKGVNYIFLPKIEYIVFAGSATLLMVEPKLVSL